MKILSDTDQQTKLVKVGGDTVRHEAELSNATVELDRSTMDNNRFRSHIHGSCSLLIRSVEN